jgi:sec-independent protein translocase protein TatC
VTGTADEDENLAEGTLLSHLIELRSRLVKITAAVIGLFIALLPFAQRIFEIVAQPLVEVLPGQQMIATDVASPLLTPFKLTFFVALFVAMPVVLYQVWAFFTAITPSSVEMMTDIASYLDFIIKIIMAFGIAFEVPVATVLIVWTGLTTREKLGKARPYVFLICFVVGMLLTPPDIISQTLLAVPVYVLYELGLQMSRFFVRESRDAPDQGS